MNTEELTTQDSDVTFDEFREEWLQEFTTQPLSPPREGEALRVQDSHSIG